MNKAVFFLFAGIMLVTQGCATRNIDSRGRDISLGAISGRFIRGIFDVIPDTLDAVSGIPTRTVASSRHLATPINESRPRRSSRFRHRRSDQSPYIVKSDSTPLIPPGNFSVSPQPSAYIAKSDRLTLTSPANLPVSTQPSSRRPRYALVIGNSTYRTQQLKNPVNDANDMAAALRHLNFNVTAEFDASHEKMEQAIRSFGTKLNKNAVALFYYAGHAVQQDGTNYLIPVDAIAQVSVPEQLKHKSVNIEYMLAEMQNAGNGLNIVILDACRDSPFQQFTRSLLTRGLAQLPAANGTLIAFSTSPGKTADDGSGRNSPFTKSLLRNITKPGLPIEAMFKNVMREVKAETGDRQWPWYHTSIEYDFNFVE